MFIIEFTHYVTNNCATYNLLGFCISVIITITKNLKNRFFYCVRIPPFPSSLSSFFIGILILCKASVGTTSSFDGVAQSSSPYIFVSVTFAQLMAH